MEQQSQNDVAGRGAPESPAVPAGAAPGMGDGAGLVGVPPDVPAAPPEVPGVPAPPAIAATTGPGGAGTAAPARPATFGMVALAAGTLLLWGLSGMQSMLAVFRGDLQDYFGLSIRQFGFLLSVTAIPGSLGALVSGYFTDRFGARPVLRICLIGVACGMGLVATAHEKAGIFLAAGVSAFFGWALAIAINAFLVNLFPNRRRRVLSLAMVTVSLIGGSFSLLGEQLVQWHRAPGGASFSAVLHTPFAVGAVAVLLGALLYTPRGPAARAAGVHKRPGSGERGHLSGGSLLLVGYLLCHVICDTSAYNWMPKVLDSAGYARVVFHPGRVLFAFMIAYVIARSLLSVLPESRGRWALMVLPSFLGGTIFTVGVLTRDQAWTSVCYVLGGFCWAVEYPVALAMLAERAGRRFGSAVAMLWVAQGVGTFAMVSLMGAVGEHVGEGNLWKILLVPSCSFPLVGVVGIVWLWKFGRAGQQPAG